MLKIQDIVEITQGKIVQQGKYTQIKNVCIDSRKVKEGDLFVAIKGDRFDGHDFISQVVRKGVRAIIVDKKVSAPSSVSVIRVRNTVKALGLVGLLHRRQFTLPIIGITGSAGKSSTKEMIAKVLASKYRVLKTLGTQNNQIGVPLTLLRLKKQHEVAVLELGTSEAGEIEWLTKITQPNIAILTNIGQSHLLGLKNRRGVFNEKVALVKGLPKDGTVIYNADDPWLRKIKKYKHPAHKVSYSLNKPSDFRAEKIQIGKDIQFYVRSRKFQLETPVQHNISNALCAIICGSIFKVNYNNIKKSLLETDKLAGRFRLTRIRNSCVIDDTYNANPLSFHSAIRAVSNMSTNGRKIAICADMLELGEKSKSIHADLGKDIARSSFDYVLSFGTESRAIYKTLKSKSQQAQAFHAATKKALHQKCVQEIRPGDTVLIKGSRGMQLEQTVEMVKNHLKQK